MTIPGLFQAGAATLRGKQHQGSPKRYIDYTYQQNFGLGLAKEPGSIPLLHAGGAGRAGGAKAAADSSSSGNSSDEASVANSPGGGGRSYARKFDELPRRYGHCQVWK